MKISDSISPHVLDAVKLKAYWALDQLESVGDDRFTAGTLSSFLVEKHGVKTSRQAIGYALKSDRAATHKNAKGYKLMESGRKQLREVYSKEEVIVIEAGKPFSAKNVELKKILSSFAGEIRISDPYLDVATLDVIFKGVDVGTPVKILSQNLIDKPSGSFTRHLGDLRKEGYQVEIGIYSSSDLHDRYLMDAGSFWLSGNSLNHLGEKESFLVRLGEDIRQSMTATFNNRWKAAKVI
jgi:hypothetical protein